jgi:hypothetical protein
MLAAAPKRVERAVNAAMESAAAHAALVGRNFRSAVFADPESSRAARLSAQILCLGNAYRDLGLLTTNRDSMVIERTTADSRLRAGGHPAPLDGAVHEPNPGGTYDAWRATPLVKMGGFLG